MKANKLEWSDLAPVVAPSDLYQTDVGKLRRELLDRMLIFGEQHLCAALAEWYVR